MPSRHEGLRIMALHMLNPGPKRELFLKVKKGVMYICYNVRPNTCIIFICVTHALILCLHITVR